MLLLDSEALSSLAHGPAHRRDRVRGILASLSPEERSLGTVAAVLAEVVRGRRQDAAVYGSVRRTGMTIHPVDTPVGVRAGQLLGAAGADPRLAVDAFLVAAADLRGGAIIATTDAGDLERLAASTSSVLVVDLDAV